MGEIFNKITYIFFLRCMCAGISFTSLHPRSLFVIEVAFHLSLYIIIWWQIFFHLNICVHSYLNQKKKSLAFLSSLIPCVTWHDDHDHAFKWVYNFYMLRKIENHTQIFFSSQSESFFLFDSTGLDRSQEKGKKHK